MKKTRAFFQVNRSVSTGIALLAALLLTLVFWHFLRPARDLDAIRKSGRVRVILTYDPVSYFIYKGTPMGYSYELARKFCTDLDLEMDVVLVRDLNKMLPLLRAGNGDLAAHNLTITGMRKLEVSFTDPISQTTQVLVQKKDSEKNLVRDIRQLHGKPVHVRSGSAYYTELQKLQRSKGINIDIVTVPGSKNTSQLIRDVAAGVIAYTVADRNIAEANRPLYPDLDFETTISRSMPLA
jgi:membrane-bound lytic murein transglycosylase F